MPAHHPARRARYPRRRCGLLTLAALYELQRPNEVIPFITGFYGDDGIPLSVVSLWYCAPTTVESPKRYLQFLTIILCTMCLLVCCKAIGFALTVKTVLTHDI